MAGPAYLDGRIVAPGKLVTPINLSAYTVATVPTASDHTGAVIYVSNGDVNNPTMAFSDGTNWRRTRDRAVISTSI